MKNLAKNGPTVAFDEFGPLEIRPQHGRSYCRSDKPKRLPATYTRLHGVWYWLAFYDVHADRLWGYVRKRKRSQETLGVMKLLRKNYPLEQRIHLILDNFSPHHKAEVKAFCRQNNIHLIWTPTNASWLNPIECHFTPVKEFVICNSDYQSHAEQNKALNQYVRYRNNHAQTK